jgi:hypothetical protein
MTEKQKKPYEDRHAADVKRYEKEMKEKGYDLKTKKEEKAPHARSAKGIFDAERRAQLKKEGSKLTNKEIFGLLPKEWSNLPEKDKARYKKLAEEEKAKFEAAEAKPTKKRSQPETKTAESK